MFLVMKTKDFQQLIYDYYQKHGRSFAWRETDNPYHIWISEIMLQQTQTNRVELKYPLFIKRFPSIRELARASFSDVFDLWQGLGYNRRALNMYKTASIVVDTCWGVIPRDETTLKTLPGIGDYTAASIGAFAYNQPTVFVETNIRSVFIHCFFKEKQTVSDKDIYPYVKQTLDKNNPRLWYYALMDYGAMLKKTNKYLNKKSKHYTKQSPFKTSNRRVRGLILKQLKLHGAMNNTMLAHKLPDIRTDIIKKNIKALQQEGFLHQIKGRIAIQ